MKIDDPRHVRAYFENLVIASLLIPNFKDDSTIRLFLKQFGEVAEQHREPPLDFTLQNLLADAKKSIDEPATLLDQYDANLAALASVPDIALKKTLLDTLMVAIDSGMEDACTKSRLIDPARKLFEARPAPQAAAKPARAAATVMAGGGSAGATLVAPAAGSGDATMMATQTVQAGGTVPVARAAAAIPRPAGEHLNALPVGYRLNEFEFDKVLGVGGFGITYLGKDTTLNLKVAIKEYLPNELAVRDADYNVLPKSADCEETYHWGLDRFLQEARLLARFNHPNIVRVLRFFEANSTAYMMMQYEDGESLEEKLKKLGTPPDEAYLQGILFPLLDGLKVMHGQGFLHRDIKPGNIYIRRSDGSPVLLDFGAARQQMRGQEQMTAIVTPGYAPFEQYFTDGCQGPWSDIYAFGAVVYKIITGKAPPDAAARVKKDAMVPAVQAGQGRYSEKFLRAIDWALQTDEKKRPQTIEDWQRALTTLGSEAAGAIQAGAADATRTLAVQGRQTVAPKTTVLRNAPFREEAEASSFYQEKPASPWPKRIFWLLVLCGLGGGAVYFNENPDEAHDLAIKAADWGWSNDYPSFALPIYRSYDKPEDAQTPMRVATMFEEGKGTEPDKKQAFEWYRKAAERGNSAAQLKAAQMSERGEAGEVDVTGAVEWYLKAAQAGQPDAQFRLGIAYLREDNLRLTPSAGESEKWLRMAATQGHAKARELLKLIR
ncbi:MAG: SEL1-like repeat protein [Sulfuricella sp.]|nr:SEL1-like repeat protein [Sulfuricella sp.]